jgi:hypothetical protein
MGAGLSGNGIPDIAGDGRAEPFDATACPVSVRDLHTLVLLAQRLSCG